MTPLPWKIVILIFLVMFLGETTSTMCFTYLPKMVKNFGCPQLQVGYQVGMIGSALYLGWGISTFFWGFIGDVYGNKRVLLIASTGAMASGLIFGFSTSFYWALFSRFMFGLFMGMSSVLKSILVSVCDSSNISLAFSIYFSAWTIACLIGPSIAGFLVFPVEQYPKAFGQSAMFKRFPVLLPNLIVTFFWLCVITLAVKIIPKDCKSRARSCHQTKNECENISKEDVVQENECLAEDTVEEPSADDGKDEVTMNKISQSNKFYQTIIQHFVSKKYVAVLGVYLVIGSIVMTLEELFPVFAATSPTYNGLGLSTSQIGIVLLGAAIFLLVTQYFVMAKVIVILGTRRALILASIFQAIFIPLIPIAAHWNKAVSIGVSVLFMGINFVLGTASTVNVNVLVNMYTPSKIRGSSNGIAVVSSMIGRILGPLVYGNLFSWSLTNVKGVVGNETALGFPFNQFFVFILVAFSSLVVAVIVRWVLAEEADNEEEKL